LYYLLFCRGFFGKNRIIWEINYNCLIIIYNRNRNGAGMDGKITLDLNAFKALAADTRISILKSLGKRRKTLSELAEEQKLGASTVKEHLEVLQKAELVAQFDDGHKWKYWELTSKGKKIVYPEETQILVVLGGSFIALLAGIYLLFGKFSEFSGLQFSNLADSGARIMSAPAPAAMDASEKILSATAESAVASAIADEAAPTANNFGGNAIGNIAGINFPYLEIIIIVCAAILIGFCAAYFVNKKAKI
jgi:DNA-binding transcriptional ArsR family regulator